VVGVTVLHLRQPPPLCGAVTTGIIRHVANIAGAHVRFAAHNGLNLDIAPCPEGCQTRTFTTLSQTTIASFRETRLAKAVSETLRVRCVSEW
jgi:hypothetical protein